MTDFETRTKKFAKQKAIREKRNIHIFKKDGLTHLFNGDDVSIDEIKTHDGYVDTIFYESVQPEHVQIHEDIHNHKYLEKGDEVILSNGTQAHVEQVTSSQIKLSTGDKMRRSDGMLWGSESDDALYINKLVASKSQIS